MTEPLSVVFQRRAIREAEAIDEWWRSNRHAAPDLFATELEAMLGAAALMPSLGAPARSERASGERRLLLRTTRHHVRTFRDHDLRAPPPRPMSTRSSLGMNAFISGDERVRERRSTSS
jgi:nitroreductase